MSMVDCGAAASETLHGAAIRMPCANRPLHRLSAVRQQQGISRRTLARRLGMDVGQIKWQEQATSDIWMSKLYEWQEVLDVPIADLLVETEEPLSTPVMRRAQMVRLMKTAAAILERTQQVSIRRMAQMLVEQLVEIMPELASVGPWHTVGKRRTRDDLGQVAQRRLSSELFTVRGD